MLLLATCYLKNYLSTIYEINIFEESN